MNLSNLKPAKGSVNKKRIGRGEGSGRAAVHTWTQRSTVQVGYARKMGFEGGQMPLQRRFPSLDSKTGAGLFTKP